MFAHESIVIKHFETICSVDQGTAINPKGQVGQDQVLPAAVQLRLNGDGVLTAEGVEIKVLLYFA